MGKYFVKGAWLVTLDEELSEAEFIKKAGGIKKLEPYKMYPFVSIVLDDPKKVLLVGHIIGGTISLSMQSRGHEKWQTMEWK